MATTRTESEATIDVVAPVKEWLSANWDPDLTVGEWWERLGLSGWAAPMLPSDAYGRGMNRADAMRVSQAIARFGALGAIILFGGLLLGFAWIYDRRQTRPYDDSVA